MVGFDLPVVAHDMMLRFMGVDFHALSGGSASIPSSVGGVSKPEILFDDAPTPRLPSSSGGSTRDPSVWRSYYNSGTTVLVFLLIVLGIALVIYIARRRRRYAILPKNEGYSDAMDLEERVPLSQTDAEASSRELSKGERKRANGANGQGSVQERSEAIFDVGEEEDDHDGSHSAHQ